MRTSIALALVAAAVLLLVGCPSNMCLLKVCTDGHCRCSISSCQDGAGYDTKQNKCRCLKGYIAVAGQCLTPEAANEYCGAGYHWGGAGCVKSECRPGDELDLSTGWCIPKAQVDQVAANMGVKVGQGEKLGCPAGEVLVIDGPAAACVPQAQTCAPDETWTGTACQKVVTCPTGSQWDAAQGQCITYAQTSDDELTVNVGQWAQTNYGPNGGPGTAAFCGKFARKPWSFGVTAGNTAMLRVTVMLSFPDSEVARGAATATTVFDASGNPVPAKGAQEVTTAAQAVFAPLAQGGGRANAPTATTTVKCAVVNASAPQSVPTTGGV
jgi:hypothetical protein